VNPQIAIFSGSIRGIDECMLGLYPVVERERGGMGKRFKRKEERAKRDGMRGKIRGVEGRGGKRKWRQRLT
jgi:hypothetical protein